MDLLGFEVTLDGGIGRVTLELGPQHMNPHGIAHGGIAYAMMDTAMGGATMSVIENGNRCATIEVQVRYHHSARKGTLVATAWVTSKTRRVVHLGGETVDESGRLIASSTGSFAITD